MSAILVFFKTVLFSVKFKVWESSPSLCWFCEQTERRSFFSRTQWTIGRYVHMYLVCVEDKNDMGNCAEWENEEWPTFQHKIITIWLMTSFYLENTCTNKVPFSTFSPKFKRHYLGNLNLLGVPWLFSNVQGFYLLYVEVKVIKGIFSSRVFTWFTGLRRINTLTAIKRQRYVYLPDVQDSISFWMCWKVSLLMFF